ncbi:MAG TPA: hypothetical protein VFZ20_12940 [Longimicrobium sp.]|nr:hypothetical protein [Longimicrobium sp.]
MTRISVGRAAFSALVAVSLAFGAREAMAAPGAARDRGPYCADDTDCQRKCEALYPGQQVVSDCSAAHICYCGLAR